MAKRSKKDLAKAKEAKQKKIAIGGGILLVLLLAYEVPHTMKMLNNHPRPPVVASSTATPASTTTTPASTAAPVAVDPNAPLAAPTLSGSTAVATATTPASSGELVSVVPLKVDQGQLHTFQKMVSKDPFANQAPTAGSGSTVTAPSSPKGSTGGGGAASPPTAPQAPSGSSSTPSTPPASAAPVPTSAVISVNGVLMGVSVNGTFPTAAPVFELKALTATTAKVAIAGGKYANGAGTLTLRLRAPVTLQNTADGSKYVLILEPQGTPVPATGGAPTAATPTSTTPTPVIPSAGSGG